MNINELKEFLETEEKATIFYNDIPNSFNHIGWVMTYGVAVNGEPAKYNKLDVEEEELDTLDCLERVEESSENDRCGDTFVTYTKK